MKEQLRVIQQALDEHLSAINENTTEIQVLFDYLQDVERKLERVTQRLDKLQLSQGQPVEKPGVQPLSQQEKQVFLILYTEQLPLTCDEIALKIQGSAGMVVECIANLSTKGIPLQRTFAQNQFFFSLTPQFKEMQAKQNILNLSLESFMEA